ncbi:RCC1 domain-containing protein [Salimicrobium halophilum]|uniref:Alpha-tubulin suppressor n=1 Tax=Salimicrobium halophilum TaxID=86666 RepID=A0A1G8S0Z6_9BACI|nr:Ig-like domain-containing protein [Salimicrobium halophilum]SDJ22876.1 Alpha-tubulin suppressor [Salimicrobium halophilum]
MNKFIVTLLLTITVIALLPLPTLAKSMSVHSNHTLLFLSGEGERPHNMISFGRNNFAQLGTEDTDHRFSPEGITSLPPNETITSLEAGERQSFALTDNGEVYGWGSNYYGELTNKETPGIIKTPTKIQKMVNAEYVPLSNITAIKAGSSHALAIDESGSLWSWGSNELDQLGQHILSSNAKYAAKKIATNDIDIKDIAVYQNHNLVLDSSGNVYGFGQNIGNIFMKNVGRTRSLEKIENLPPIQKISTGYSHVLALDESGDVWSWGHNYFGQSNSSGNPERIDSLTNITDIASGHSHNLAIDESGTVYGWGENNYGELTGREEIVSSPKPIALPEKAQEVEAGYGYSLARTSATNVYTWGKNDFGQLGDGTGMTQTEPRLLKLHFVESIDIKETNVQLEKGETYQLEATVSPESAINQTIYWDSSNPDVVTVDENGEITAVGDHSDSNTAIIKATSADGGFTDTVKVSVQVPVTDIDIVKNSLTLERTLTDDGLKEDRYTLEFNVYPHHATDKRVIWSSSDPSVARVNPQGTVTSVSEGEATITATSINGGFTDAIPVEVRVPVNEIHIVRSEELLKLWEDEEFQLEYNIFPEFATDQRILQWESDNKQIATVDNEGIITAHSPGTSTIRVTTLDNRRKGSLELIVEEGEPSRLSGFTIQNKEISMSALTFQKINTTFFPSENTNKRMEWKSKNREVATVSWDGTIFGKASGSTEIIGTTESGGYQQTVKVNVTESEEGWRIFPQQKEVDPNKEWTLSWNTSLDPASVTSENVYIQDMNGNIVDSVVGYNEETVTVSPSSPLTSKAQYYLIVNENVTSSKGIPIEHNVHMLFQVK